MTKKEITRLRDTLARYKDLFKEHLDEVEQVSHYLERSAKEVQSRVVAFNRAKVDENVRLAADALRDEWNLYLYNRRRLQTRLNFDEKLVEKLTEGIGRIIR